MDTLHTSVCGSDPVSDLFTFRVWRKTVSVFVCLCATYACLCRSCSQIETWFWMLCYFFGKSWRCSCRMSKWMLQSLHRSIIPNRYLFKEYCCKCQLSLCMLSNTISLLISILFSKESKLKVYYFTLKYFLLFGNMLAVGLVSVCAVWGGLRLWAANCWLHVDGRDDLDVGKTTGENSWVF